MLVRASSYKASISRDHGSGQGSGIVAILGIGAVYLGIAVGFFWLLQPTVVKNNGVAAYNPPPATVISAAAVLPPPGPAEPLVALAPPAPEIMETPAAAPKKEASKREAREARPAPRRERVVAQPRQGWDNQQRWNNSRWDYASSYRSQGSRPWF